MSDLEQVLRRFAEGEAAHMEALARLCAIPSVTAESDADPGPRRRAAEFLVYRARKAGLETRLAEVEGAPPYVTAEWMDRPGAPTVLLYGHYDVMPPGRPEVWRSSPWDLRREGDRLFARGVADNKGGCLLGLAVLEAWMSTAGGPPVNVRVILEGEEESGSPHFPDFLRDHGGLAEADIALILDGGNFEAGLPTILCSTRGACLIEVCCEGAGIPLHSGMWGGALPDPALVLSNILADLVDERGRIAVPDFYDKVREASAAERAEIARIDDRAFLTEAHLAEGAVPWGEEGYSALERAWIRPCVVASVLEGRDRARETAAYMERAWARFDLRTVPDMDTLAAGEALVRHILSRPSRGAKVSARILLHAPWWRIDPEDPAVLAASRALAAGYGRDALRIGTGGTIGILAHLMDRHPGLRCLVLGVEDPAGAVHGENESLSLEEWRRMGASLVRMLGEFGGSGAS